mgnify:FL=1
MNTQNFYVYLLTNKNRTCFYIGMTNDLVRRMIEHKSKRNDGFTSKYNISKLVYYECYFQVEHAIAREKQLKRWRRLWKIELIEKVNAEWNDLSESIGVTDEMVKNSAKEFHGGPGSPDQVRGRLSPG